MNNHLSLTLATIFLSTILYGQGITKEEILKHKIRSITAIDHNEIIKSIEYFNDNGEIARLDDNDEKTRKEFVYDSNRLLTEERTYNTTDGKINQIMKFLYNEANQLIKRELSNTYNVVTTTWIFEYDQNGNRTKVSQSGATGNDVTFFKYEAQLIKLETTKKTFGKEETTSYKYNENGQLSETKSILNGNTIFTVKYSYDEKGKIIKINTKQITGSSFETSSKTTYKYNDKGLLEAMTWKNPLDHKLNKIRYIINF